MNPTPSTREGDNVWGGSFPSRRSWDPLPAGGVAPQPHTDCLRENWLTDHHYVTVFRIAQLCRLDTSGHDAEPDPGGSLKGVVVIPVRHHEETVDVSRFRVVVPIDTQGELNRPVHHLILGVINDDGI